MADSTAVTDGSAARVGGGTGRVFVDKRSPQAYRALVKTSGAVGVEAAEAGLDRTLIELVNLRVSQINGCAYCLKVHTEAALRGGESTLRLGVLAAWRDTEVFTARERAALALAEATTAPADTRAREEAHAAAAGVFTEAETSAVIWVAITINAFNRVSVMSGHPVKNA
ncbi:carboxymuconolactone decarboxylase family protein [Streptomyces albidoflavus]|uniref:carboxymuconolactone decarboxylase family protein n=1 Tax=Streptomyces TaxID=1883 RepID=UPI00063ECCBA|nr:carboxymuconolactone decarboxylase family protein [Streptomyces sp. KE1]KLI99386.1 carboxymuconolactone decarboxylase [Streptomyces sp. KE1]